MKNIPKIINFNSLKHNIFCIKQNYSQICAVVKANAYGHGIKNIVPTLDEYVSYFAVNTIKEAHAVRKHSNRPILVLCGFSSSELKYASQNNIHLAVFCKKQLYTIQKYVAKYQKNVCLHLKIDSGMNRLGFKTADELKEVLDEINKNSHIKLCGIFTHFGGGHEERKTTQKKRFKSLLEQVNKNILVHCKSSNYIAENKIDENEMLRCGLAIYGYGNPNLKPILSIKAKIIFVGKAKKGEYIGYGTDNPAKKNITYAVLAIGYADGLMRNYAKKGYVIINGKKAKICASICMNMTIVDVSGISAKVGDYATIMDEKLNANEIAKMTNTIPYEVLTNFR